MEIFKLTGISYGYREGIPALCDVGLSFREGRIAAVIGANGSGKSTLFQVMAGLIYPSAGTVLFRGREVSERTLRDTGFLRSFRQAVGYVFQDPDVQLFCPTVLDDLLFGPLHMGLAPEEAGRRASEVMELLGIGALRDRPPHMLSEGEKKKAAIGSVLTVNPDVIILDEPTNGLDPRTESFIVELMLALNGAGKTILIATHDLSLVDELQADVVVLSEEHRVEKTGPSGEILGDEMLLLRVNLIHEHIHLHGPHAHRHSHFFFHRH